MKYKLGSLTVTNWNDWDRVPRDPISTAIAAAVTGATAGTAYLAVYALSTIAISAVTSWAISALSPKPDFSSFGSSGTLVNARDAVAPADFVYGEVRKGGVVTFYESTGDENKFLHQIIAIAAHEVDDIGDIYLNDQVATWNSSTGLITTAGTGDEQTDWQSKIRIRKHLGNQTAADSDLVSETSVTSAFVGNGIAYLYARYEYDQNVFANGLPLVTVMVRGKKVYDPRTESVAYNNNAALCMRDFLTSAYGLGDNAIDDVTFESAANECDENVTLDAGGTEKRYTINGIVKANTPLKTVFGNMSTACAGTLFWGSGYWKLKVGAYTPPVKTLTLDDLRGPINLQTRISMRDNFNTIRGTFNDADQDYITADYPELTSATFKTEDNGEEVALDLPLPFTTSAATAQRLAKLTLLRGREQMTLSADFGLEAFSIEVGDIIAFDNPRYGFDEKEFEVIGWSFAANQQAGDLRVTLTLRETSEASFDWNADESAIIGNNTTLPQTGAGLVINNLTATAGGRTQGDGTFINTAVLDWDDAASAFVEFYDVEWKVTAAATYNSTTSTDSSIEISPLVDGVQYTFRVRAVASRGNVGGWAEVTLTAGGDDVAPSTPTSVTAEGGFEYITVRWTNPPEDDLSFVEIWENDTNTTTGSSLVGTISGNSFVRSNLGINATKWYFLRAVDYSGNTSGFTSGVSATTTFVDDNAFEDGIYSLFTDQGLYAIRDVTSLPPSGAFTGEKVFNRTDGKLYQWTGSAWELVVAQVNAPDINGQLVTNQIQVNAITSDLIAANAITETKITSNAITTPKLAAGAVTAGEIAAGAVTAVKIATNAITSDKIVAGTIQANDIAAGAITANEIAGNTITGNKIVANTITGGLLATSGIITNSAQITDAVVTNAKIGNLAVSTIKIADQAVSNTGADEDSVSNWTSTNYTTVASVTLSTEAGNQVILWAAGSIVFGGIGGEGSPSAASVRLLKGGTVLETYENLTPQTASQTLAAPCVIASATSDSTSTTFHVQVAKANAGGDASLSPTMLLVATELKK